MAELSRIQVEERNAPEMNQETTLGEQVTLEFSYVLRQDYAVCDLQAHFSLRSLRFYP